MKKFAIVVTIIILQQQAFAQGSMGIGTATPNPSAALDITAYNKGLLIPRVYLQSTIDGATIPLPALSLLVYNQNALMPGGKGFYFNSGSPASPNWKPLMDINMPFYKATSDSAPAFQVENYSPYYASAGIRGFSQGGHALEGVSGTGQGVNAFSTLGSAVYANSTSGTGVYTASISGDALQAVGNVKITGDVKMSGNVKISGGNTSAGYGKVLTSDATGNATWQDSRLAFRARGVNANYNSIPDNEETKVEFAIEEYDYGNDYNYLASGAPTSNSSTYTIPKSGVYHFDVQVRLTSNIVFDVARTEIMLKLKRSGSTVNLANNTSFPNGVNPDVSSLSTDLKLLAGDQVWVTYYQKNNSFTSSSLETGGLYNYFSAHLLFAD